MMPYADSSMSIWTGFFSSRPLLKKEIVDLSSEFHASGFLVAIKNLIVINKEKKEIDLIKQRYFAMQEALGIMMHHDGITGTSRELTVRDYERRISIAMKSNAELMGGIFE